LETGEFLRVGASKVMKTNVRVVAATNENMSQAISSGKFREDLYYRLSTVPIKLPTLKERKDDIHLLFRKFAHDFAEKYRMPAIKLSPDAVDMIQSHQWPGNIRQLKNLVEQVSVIETAREIDSYTLSKYIQNTSDTTDIVLRRNKLDTEFSERELMYKFLFDMKKDLTELKKLVVDIISKNGGIALTDGQTAIVNKMYSDVDSGVISSGRTLSEGKNDRDLEGGDNFEIHQEIEESLSLEDREKDLIKKALEKHRGKRKYAASELGISERTLYRKIKEYNLNNK
jgi:DNA-binding NtrC family response regulator